MIRRSHSGGEACVTRWQSSAPSFRLLARRRGSFAYPIALLMVLFLRGGSVRELPPQSSDSSLANSLPEVSQAQRLFARAEELRAQTDRESCLRAVELDLRALELARAKGDQALEAEILTHLGWIYRKYLSEPHRALSRYGEALEVFRALRDEARQSSVLNNLGRVHFVLGETEQAVDCWQQALELKRKIGDQAGEAASLSNLALYRHYLGDVQRALELYDQSLELSIRMGDRLQQSRVLNNRGRLYQTLGDNRQALNDLERARVIAREIDDGRGSALLLTAIGNILNSQGDPERAVVALEEALELRSNAEDERGEAVTLGSLASAYEQLGRVAQAAESNRRALDIFRRIEAPRSRARALETNGRLAMITDSPELAFSFFSEALGAFRQLRDPYGEIRSQLGLAAAARSTGQLSEALDLMKEALSGVEQVRSGSASLYLRVSYLASKQNHYDVYIDLLMEMHRNSPFEGYDLKALGANERSRARALLEQISEGRTSSEASVPEELWERKQRLAQRLDVIEQERFRQLDYPKTPARAARLKAMEAKLDYWVREHRVVLGKIRAARSRVAALSEPGILDAKGIQALLEPNTLLLEYRLGPERSYLWAVTNDSVTSFVLPSRSEVESAARSAYDLLKRSHFREQRSATAAALNRIADMLLSPVTEVLAQHDRLVVVGDGSLHYIPFASLPTPFSAPDVSATSNTDGETSRRLVFSHEVTHLPSFSALANLRKRVKGRSPPPGLVAVLADPIFEYSNLRLSPSSEIQQQAASPQLQRLRFARQEAKDILGLVDADRGFLAMGFEATREAAIHSGLRQYRYVHFATHGVLDSVRPELTRLVFSQVDSSGRPIDGNLYAHELYGLDLPVEMVTLSGCETALGKEIHGEGLLGLTQGFFQAGAPRVVVSLWQVDDRATAGLMTRFYKALMVNGLAPAPALRAAQLSIQQETGWQAPYYWAAFVLQGEWRAPG